MKSDRSARFLHVLAAAGLVACAGESGAPPVARDDLAIVAVAGGGVRVDVLHNDADPAGGPLRIVGAETESPDVDVTVSEDARIEVRPPAGYRGTVSVTYRIVATSGQETDARLTVAIDSWFAPVIDALDAGDAGSRMIDVFDPDGAPPVEPTMLVVLRRGGRDLLVHSWGTVDDELTRFPMASASKWLAAGVTLHARDEGRVALDDAFRTHLPWFTAPELDGTGPQRGDSTLGQAFAMTSGLFSGHRYHTMRAFDHATSVEHIRFDPGVDNGLTSGPVPMAYPPGERVAYDGKGMQVAGLAVVEAYDGEHAGWPELAEATLLGPCGMSETTWDYFAPNPAVAGGVVTTARDYLRFLDMIVGGGRCGDTQILSETSLADLWSFHLTPADSVAPERAPIVASPWPNCGATPYEDGTPQSDCTTWPDGTATPGTYYPEGVDAPRYALGAWALAVRDGRIEALVSPGAFLTAPFIDRSREVVGIFFTNVEVDGGEAREVQWATELYMYRELMNRVDELDAGTQGDLAPTEDL